MTKIKHNFSEQPADLPELFCTLGVFTGVGYKRKSQGTHRVYINLFHLSGQLRFQKEITHL